ncbi:MAG: hypothetical protein R8F63_01985 [Acidimicrobiales bacterium]|nr:hypothetical protein [Acidimicrobiales bacterium]
MKRNEPARKVLAKEIPATDLLVVLPLSQKVGVAGASSDGAARSGSTVYSLPYARGLGIDHTTRGHRLDLVDSWLVVTPTELRFYGINQWSLTGKPKGHRETIARDGVSLGWFDTNALTMVNRVLHFHFPDGTHLLSATMLRAGSSKKTYNDEPQLLVEQFGDAATEVG